LTEIPPPFDTLWLRALLGFIIGTILGSFITMLSYRLPRKQSIIRPPSACPHCHTSLKIRDLLPVISWISARGKCRQCGATIGVRYVVIEIITGVLCAVAFALVSFQPLLIAILIAILSVVTMVTIQLERD
jgi:prepilin signal peptidase PulO-like enzyme (type II secretory pathway)